MSAVAAELLIPQGAAAKGGKKKKLFLILGIVLVLLLAAGAGVVWWLKHRAHAAEAAAELAAGEEEGGKAQAVVKIDTTKPPVFLPLDAFIVNLADRDVERFAQIGITFEVENAALAEQVKAYMPAVRNAILMVLASKSSRDLMDRPGKELLAEEIMREAVRPMGIEIAAPTPVTPAPAAAKAKDDEASGDTAAAPVVVAATVASAPAAKPKPRGAAQKNPIQHVHFSSFIIQ